MVSVIPSQVDTGRLLNGFIALLLLSFGLYGVLTTQIYIYVARFPKDPYHTKFTVALLWLLETVHTVLSGRVTFYYTVFALKEPLNLERIDWSVGLVLWTEIGIVAIAQGCYIRRIWIMSEHALLLTGIPVFLFFARIGFLSASAYHMFHYPTWASFQGTQISNLCVETAIALSVAADLVVAATMVYYCRTRAQTERGSKLQDALHSLMTYSIHSGLVTSAASLCLAITYACLKDNLVFVGLAATVSKLYSNSLLGMLNARVHLRSMMYDGTAININLEALSDTTESASA